MTGKIAFLFYLSIINGSLAVGKPWHWRPWLPVHSDGSFKPSGSIMGGTELISNTWPHLVNLFIDNMYFCIGSLISNEWVLTAAHCMDGSGYVDVVMGAYSSGGSEETQVVMRSDVSVIHENWNSFLLANDIAVIKLPEPVDFNEYISSVGLPSADVAVGDILTAMNWGKASDGPGGIFEVNSTAISNTECAFYFGPIVDGGILCVEAIDDKGTCDNAFGGSVNKDGKIYGVGSFASSGGCEQGYPVAYTRVVQFLDWIERATGVTP